MPATMSEMWAISVATALRNLRRAGVLKKSCATVTMVPGAAPVSEALRSLPPSMTTSVPESAAASRVTRENRETAAMLGSASPRKPSVRMRNRSSSVAILLVA